MRAVAELVWWQEGTALGWPVSHMTAHQLATSGTVPNANASTTAVTILVARVTSASYRMIRCDSDRVPFTLSIVRDRASRSRFLRRADADVPIFTPAPRRRHQRQPLIGAAHGERLLI